MDEMAAPPPLPLHHFKMSRHKPDRRAHFSSGRRCHIHVSCDRLTCCRFHSSNYLCIAFFFVVRSGLLFFRRPFPFFFILSNLVFIFGLVNCWFGQKTTRCDSFSFPPGLSWEIVHSLALIDFYLIQFESLNTLSSKSGLQNDFPIGLTQHSRETLSLKKGFR